jgi:high-affinity K+ transport system ATPase subunit B
MGQLLSVLCANFAEAVAEGRCKAQAAARRYLGKAGVVSGGTRCRVACS